MAELLRIFVSATNDLEAERAVIGTALAELPIQIGAEVRRTPARGAKYDDIYELIANVDRVYFLMGRDITAPAGAEWHLAWQLERSIAPLRRPGRLTLAAQEFIRTSLVEWQMFREATDLARTVTLDLIRILQHPTNRYGLTVAELELLALRRQKLSATAARVAAEPGGAEGGGVILDTGRREPVEGVALDEEL
jgi:hypothetical protein